MKRFFTMAKKLVYLLAVILMLSYFLPYNVPLIMMTTTVQAATVSINKKSAELVVGDTLQLKISGTKNKITWATDNKSVATVNKSGLVTAKAKGKATITATVNNKKYKCKVTVINPYIYPEDAVIYVGETQIFELKGVKSDKVIKWSSSDKSIAVIDSDGELTAKKAGTVTITATVDKKKYKRKVTVLESISLSEFKFKSLIYVMNLDEECTLDMDVNPSNYDINNLIWESDDESVAEFVSAGKVKAVGYGKTYIRVSDKNGELKDFTQVAVIKENGEEPNIYTYAPSNTYRDTSVVVFYLQNLGTKAIRISKDANLIDNNYSYYDRSLLLIDANSVEYGYVKYLDYLDVQPDSEAYVCFIVDGDKTTFSANSNIYFEFMYDDRYYYAVLQSEDNISIYDYDELAQKGAFKRNY